MDTLYVVAVYEIDRAYGGPEEGGWWYTHGELRQIHGVRRTREAAEEYRAEIQNRLDAESDARGVRSLGSVLYSGGRYQVKVYENTAPQRFPDGRPHYE